MADSNLTALRYVKETTRGTTPSSALQTLRFTGEDLRYGENSTESQEILSDRQLSDLIRTARWGEGGFQFELSYGTYDDFIAAALADEWSSNVLENGTTKTYFTLEKEFQVDGSPSSHFFAYKGMAVDTLSLDLSLESVVTGSFALMGNAPTNATTTAGTGAATAATSSDVMSVLDITTLTVDDASPASTLSGATNLTLNVGNALRRQMALTSTDPFGIGYGSFSASGSISYYFADADLYDDFEAETAQEIIITISDGSNSYTITVPKAKLANPRIQAGGKNQDVLAQYDWTALKDASTGKMLLWSRA